MLAAKARYLRHLFTPEPLSLRETDWGYVIRSAHPDSALPKRWVYGALAGGALFWIVLWLAPGIGAVWKAAYCLLVLAALHFGLKRMGQAKAHELQVDMRRRELRLGVVTAAGDTWIKGSLRFDEIDGSTMKRAGGKCVLWLQIKGSQALAPAGVGSEAELLQINERLARDLKPVASQVSSYKLASNGAKRAGGSRFPPLSPPEYA
ncbi:hypothetical protein [Pseudoruegeria sp. HB172150]|uniref:hypothetical protein n=1 Tax=Pseudoruegeria sp. HB172150 TaxID=2721164 RepID=UPI001553E261|nr:hypothetical protein [Pseudoruegeria sp. HB172150]